MHVRNIIRPSLMVALASGLIMTACAPSQSSSQSSSQSPISTTPISNPASTPGGNSVASPSPNASSTPSTPKTPYPEAVVQTFMDSCMSSGGNRAQCTCSIDKIQERFSFDEFKAVEEEIQRTNQVPEALKAIIEACRSAT